MLVKIYGALWLVLLAVAAIVAVTGNFTMLASVWFGFVAFGMVFMGMMGVLPAIVSEVTHKAPTPPRPAEDPAQRSTSIPELLKSYGESLATVNAVEIPKPKYR